MSENWKCQGCGVMLAGDTQPPLCVTCFSKQSKTKRQFIVFALNEWDDKELINKWAAEHGYKDASGIAKHRFYEYLNKCHIPHKKASVLNNVNQDRLSQKNAGS